MSARVLVLFTLCAISFAAEYPGISVLVQEGGFQEIANVIDQFVSQNLGPVNIPDENSEGFDYSLQLSGMQIQELGWRMFSTDVEENEGIELTIDDLNFNLVYDLVYDITFPPLSGNISSMLTINETDLIFLFEFIEVNGKPQISINSYSFQIGYLDLRLPWYLQEIEKYLDPVVRGLVDRTVTRDVIPLVNSELASFLSNLTTTISLPLTNNTLSLDIALINNPKFSASDMRVDMRGRVVGLSSPCPWNNTHMQLYKQRNFGVFVNAAVLQCALFGYEQSGYLNNIANTLLQSTLNLDNRIALSLKFSSNGNSINVLKNQIVLNVQFEADVSKNALDPIFYLSLASNISTSVSASVTKQGVNILVMPQINTVNVSLNVTEEGKDMPERYKQEIAATDFKTLSQRANDFLKTSVLPSLNKQLAQGIPITVFGQEFFTSPELLLDNSFVFVGFNISFPFATDLYKTNGDLLS